MKSTRTEPQPCLDCGTPLDAIAGADHNHKPRPGSITICFTCGHVMALTTGLKFRPLTDEEMLDIAGDEHLLAIQKARALAMQKAKGEP